MDQYALYLRKSRADMDAEARGEGETLAKHRTALTEYAKRRGLFIAEEYAEIVSGDTIAARPQMQQLLSDVKAGLYAGVIVNDVDRLGRGDSIDQEIIKTTFAYTHTLIITPSKDIDFSNTTDEDIYDFKAFFSRTEYKMISRRMKQGRVNSAAQGSWVSGVAPFGYRVVRDKHYNKLEPDENAPIVKMIFELYASGAAGYRVIANRIDAMGILTTQGKHFGSEAIKRILLNPVYLGRTEYGRRATVSTIEDGKRIKRRVKSGDAVVVENTHEALIDMDTWQTVQNRARLAHHRTPVNANAVMKNPLAGLVRCSECGAIMQRGHGRYSVIRCMTPNCKTSAIYLKIVENELLEILKSWNVTYEAPAPQPVSVENTQQRNDLLRQLETISAQLTRAQELVELGVYTPSEYITRRDTLQGEQKALHAKLDKLTRKTPGEARAAILPEIQRVLDAYPMAQSAEDKNALLRSVIDHVVYHKTESAKGGQKSDNLLSLDVFPVVSM